jgi:hypothetical protein
VAFVTAQVRMGNTDMASLDDLLSAQKNGVVALNSIANYDGLRTGYFGNNNTKEIAAATTKVIKTSSGWLATISVIAAGSTTGYIYDTNNASLLTGNRIYAIPSTLAIGIYQIQIPFATGLTIVTGTGSIVSLTYT